MYSKSKEGGSGGGYVSVHPRIFAAKNAYQSCDDAPPDGYTECIEGVALKYNFFNTLDDEMNVVIALPEGCPPPAIVPDLQLELDGQFVVDEARPKKIIGRILERKIGPLIGFFEKRTAEWGDFDVIPGQTVVIPMKQYVATETWLLPRGYNFTYSGPNCNDRDVHHAFFVRDEYNMAGAYEPDAQPSWPPDSDLTNDNTVNVLDFPITRNSLRDEQFCWHNPTNTSDFCDEYFQHVATDPTIPKGLPELWERTLFRYSNAQVLANFVEVDKISDDLLETLGYLSDTLEGYYFHGNYPAVGYRDEVEFRFRDVEYNDQCVNPLVA